MALDTGLHIITLDDQGHDGDAIKTHKTVAQCIKEMMIWEQWFESLFDQEKPCQTDNDSDYFLDQGGFNLKSNIGLLDINAAAVSGQDAECF